MTATNLDDPVVVEGRLERPDGRTIAWSETGVLDGRPLLRFPGTPGSRLAIRDDQTPWHERGLRVITTERPGYGASTELPGRRFADTADDVAAILDELDIATVPVFGGSGGAPHLLSFASRYPDRVQAATIVVGAAPIARASASIASRIGDSRSIIPARSPAFDSR